MLKVGDKVRVLLVEPGTIDEETGISFVQSMEKYIGKVFTIQTIYKSIISLEGIHYNFGKSWLSSEDKIPSFKATKEIFTYLLTSGNSVTFRERVVGFNSEGSLVNEGGVATNESFKLPEDWEPYTEPEWYENIPEKGILCYVSDNEIPFLIKLVCRYKDPKFITETAEWRKAIPLTKQELQEFLDNAPR